MMLKQIARDMRATVLRSGRCVRELSRGLRLELAASALPPGAEGGVWRLVLSRPSVDPSEREIEIVRAAFGVPAEAQAQAGAQGVIIEWPMN